jgi:hypothetical protein
MAPNYHLHSQRRTTDDDIVNLNNVGLSLAGIAKRLNVHHTTITYRLKALGISPIDTRRAFMEDIFEALSPPQQEWLIGQLHPGYPVKDYVRSLLIQAFMKRGQKDNAPESHF